jgi:hypothetical protein
MNPGTRIKHEEMRGKGKRLRSGYLACSSDTSQVEASQGVVCIWCLLAWIQVGGEGEGAVDLESELVRVGCVCGCMEMMKLEGGM